MVRVKICGLKEKTTVAIALEQGADFIGFVFFEKSPRFLKPELAKNLSNMSQSLGQRGKFGGRVGLFVNPSDAELSQVLETVKLDYVQLHGEETPDRILAISKKFNIKTIKSIPISNADDLKIAQTYDGVADMLLFDAKAPKDATRPGGNAVAFDWTILDPASSLLKGLHKDWFLAGGLTPFNVQKAIEVTGAKWVDCSSGVESSPGVKDGNLIKSLLQQAKNHIS